MTTMRYKNLRLATFEFGVTQWVTYLSLKPKSKTLV